MGLFFTDLARLANCKKLLIPTIIMWPLSLTRNVEVVSSKEFGDIVQMMRVLELPPNDDWRIRVNLESR